MVAIEMVVTVINAPTTNSVFLFILCMPINLRNSYYLISICN
ncbi:hypothetical protein VCRA2116O29_340050 [Vibrio crassostreae]|nr:hypothetical protein VCRA2116O29_340050 [Vibrio crassostreae]CAK2820626.1 hypothetical protein VCRA2120E331_210005 [Vibrio crassostreae]CAK3039427.1 hypothetical protein VCRA2133E348_580001 [Vibrio crassostreae]CAK3331343.1 hypothetical protein VCRA2127O345_210091 [Vibrio crassostreae]CAK3335089.1 hypothetical protein VCRA2120E330_210005 [Vibrio crassostreae]